MTLAVTPGHGWRWARRFAQLLTLVVIVSAPLLGGWQRLDRSEMAKWDNTGWELPHSIRDSLPLGDQPKRAYRALKMTGGGSAAEYLSIPAIDPVVGLAAATRGGLSSRFFIALLIPLLLAALVGRFFCGWLCPFGILARATQSVLSRLPIRPPRYRIPTRRPVRWVILATTVVVSAFGSQLLVIYALPHVLAQQTVYSMWLLGGGGALLGALLGLMVAGIAFGPTLYCATLCPTGAALSACGNLRVARISLTDKSACGAHCSLCDNDCWLGLQPSSGDPGPDCDLCARCVPVCPQTNMHVRLSKPHRRHLPVVMSALLLLPLLTNVAEAAPVRAEAKPDLVLNGERIYDGVTVAVSIVDLTGIKRDPDARQSLRGVEVTVFIARGERPPANERGLLASRDVYRGPLTVSLRDVDGNEFATINFDKPNSPISTPRRTMYRRRLGDSMRTGDRVTIKAIPGWLDHDVHWTIREPGTSRGLSSTLLLLLATALAYAGLLSLALLLGGVKPGSSTKKLHPA